MSEDFAAGSGQSGQPASQSLLLAQLYREIGLAAIAVELGIELEDYEIALASSSEAGHRELAA